MTQTGKPLANAMYIEPHYSEVTLTIECTNNENHHETLMLDIRKKNYFTYKNFQYSIPASKAEHYPHSFWDFPRKLGNFFEQHKTLGSLFDWFKFRKNISAEIGFLYEENNAEPLILKPQTRVFNNVSLDWALINYHLQHNTSFEDAMQDAHDRLKGHQETPLTTWILIAVGIMAIVAVIILISTYTGNHNQTVQQVQNVTFTPSPSPFRRP